MVRTLLTSLSHRLYRVPLIGMSFRRMLEKIRGKQPEQDREYWNQMLRGWASSYLGGTLSNDFRDATTLFLIQQFAPAADAILDLGCAGATLGKALENKIKVYHGVDISDVAIAKARSDSLSHASSTTTSFAFFVSTIQEFPIQRKYDAVIFNEVLYYIPLEEIPVVISRYSRCLTQSGVFIISLKHHALCYLIQDVLMSKLDVVQSFLFQQQSHAPAWRIMKSQETPAYLVQVLRVKDSVENTS